MKTVSLGYTYLGAQREYESATQLLEKSKRFIRRVGDISYNNFKRTFLFSFWDVIKSPVE